MLLAGNTLVFTIIFPSLKSYASNKKQKKKKSDLINDNAKKKKNHSTIQPDKSQKFFSTIKHFKTVY